MLRRVLELALPVIVVQLGWMAMGVADTVMTGHLSASALAAVALGNLYFFTVSIAGWGALMALDPIIAQAIGAHDDAAVARGIQRGLLIAALLSVPIALALLVARPVLELLRQPPELIPVAAAYARVCAPGVPALLAFVVARQSLQAMGRMTPIVITIVVANLANVALNWVLIFGELGFPALGAVGSGWATTISRWLMAFMLPVVAWRALRPSLLPLRREALAVAPLARMLHLGIPIGLQWQLEYGAFAVIGLLMGWLGPQAMAGHQIALNIASVTFMVPLGFASAAAVLVGQAVGRGDVPEARHAARVSLACGAGFMLCTAAVMRLIPGPLARLYSGEMEAVVVAATLIPIAGVFQVFDGTQAVSAGVLRGVGDTRAPLLVNVLGFWLLGMPVSLWLGFRAGLGAVGLWWGLVVGLAAVALFLLLRIRSRLARPVRRVMIDEEKEVLSAG
ncbi:MAG TPA: MATE family efflux transporter [Gemmatimonadaceae bacterium]|nr:MATE family efflux transporter [Gemmatimonadaceae bacterium]